MMLTGDVYRDVDIIDNAYIRMHIIIIYVHYYIVQEIPT